MSVLVRFRVEQPTGATYSRPYVRIRAMGATPREVVYANGGHVRVAETTYYPNDDDEPDSIIVALPNNEDLIPSTSYYVAFVPNGKGERKILFRVTGTGSANIEDLLIDEPGEVEASALSAHIASVASHADWSNEDPELGQVPVWDEDAGQWVPSGVIASDVEVDAKVEAEAELREAAVSLERAERIEADEAEAQERSESDDALAGIIAGLGPGDVGADPAGSAAGAVEAHRLDTTDVHGIANTANLETTAGAQAKVDAAIAALIAGAPGALDTLDELAAAFGDDANFASTVANALASKQPLDSDLTAIAGLTPANDDLIQRKAGTWINRSPAQLKTDLALVKGDVGLGNVDNTSDAAKPVSTVQQAALDTKQPLDTDLSAIAALDSSTAGAIASDGAGWIKKSYAAFKAALGLTKGDVGLGNVDNTSDASKPVSAPQQTALDAKQGLDADLTAIAGLDSATSGAIASDGAGWIKKTYAQFKIALALTKSDVGLGNVDNTSDASKPVSTAQAAADALAVHLAGVETITGVKTFNADAYFKSGRPWVDVRPGAAGDGSTDDTAAIQAAIDQAAVSGGRVYLPPGTYKITGKLIPKSGVWIQGAGRFATVVKAYGANYGAFDNSGTLAAPLTDITITDLTIDCTNVVDTTSFKIASKCIRGQFYKRLTLRNLYCYNSPATGIGTDYLVDSVIEGCIIENCGRQYVALAGTLGGNGIGIGTGEMPRESVTVANCHVLGTGNNGIMFEQQLGTYSDGLYAVIGCTSRGGQFGFRDSGDKNVRVVGSSFVDNSSYGMIFDSRAGLSSDSALVEGCEIAYNGNSGVRINSVNNEGLKLRDNRIHHNTNYGVAFVTGGNGTHIEGNEIYSNTLDGINFGTSPDRVAIKGNDIRSNASGITVVSSQTVSRLRLLDNFIHDNTAHGVQCSGTPVGWTVSGNSVRQNGSNGITFTKKVTNCRITNNDFILNGLTGLHSTAGWLNSTIADNTLYDNGTLGTAANNDGMRIDGATNGVTNVSIVHNRCFDDQGTKTQAYGIRFASTLTDVDCRDNDLMGNLTGAILIGSASTTLRLRNNKGYNPVGITQPAIGASPATVTNGNSPATLYAIGGTVSTITKGGVTIYNGTDKAVDLEPNESVVITYTGAPALALDTH